MKASLGDYLRSQGDELRARAARVRQLIGDAHWGRDGQHKEDLLMEVLRRHLPARYAVMPGFVVAADEFPSACSREQDLVIWEGYAYPWLMRGESLAIGFVDACRAALSIKTTVDRAQFMDMWETLGSIPSVERGVVKVGFVYDESSFPKMVETVYEWFGDAIAKSGCVNMQFLATAGSVFGRVDVAGREATVRLFSSREASFGLMLGAVTQELGDRFFDLSVALDAIQVEPLGEPRVVPLR